MEVKCIFIAHLASVAASSRHGWQGSAGAHPSQGAQEAGYTLGRWPAYRRRKRRRTMDVWTMRQRTLSQPPLTPQYVRSGDTNLFNLGSYQGFVASLAHLEQLLCMFERFS